METKKVAASQPSYHKMIGEAITALKERIRSSQIAIAKYIKCKHNCLPKNFKKTLFVQLRGLAASGKLTIVKSSFKLAKPISAEKKKATKSKSASVKKVKVVTKKAGPTMERVEPAKKKAAPSKARVTPAKKKVTAVVKQKVKKVSKSLVKKEAAAKEAKK